jgi:hypothetical protein
MEANVTQAIPKKGWIFRMQGLDEAPSLVKLCHKSWKDLNPNWKIIFLDKSNVEAISKVRDNLRNVGATQ